MRRVLLLVALLLSESFVTARPVSKNFLLSTYFRVRNGEPLWQDGLSSSEARFIRRLHRAKLDQVRQEPRKSKEIYRYNLLHFRSPWSIASDLRAGKKRECAMVWAMPDGSFVKRPLGVLFNSKPHGAKWSFSYCATIDHGHDPNSLLYFFHGVTGTPRNFRNRNALAAVRRKWREQNKPPVWVSISMGRVGALSDRGTLKRFVKYAAPYIEAQLSQHLTGPVRRYGLGISMGGANVLQLALRAPRFLDSAFLVCPAISYLDGRSTPQDVQALAQRTNAYAVALRIAMGKLGEDYQKVKYLRRVDPLLLGQNALSTDSTPMYIQGSSQDEFGFDEGARLFSMVAASRRAPVTYDELVGRHCVLEPKTIVDYFAPATSTSSSSTSED